MDIASLVITKPGGITVSEALAKQLPMIVICPIPGQEESNTEYLIKNNAAVRVDKIKDLRRTLEYLLANQDKIKALKKSATSISKPNAAQDIAKLLLDLCGNHSFNKND